MKTLFLNPPSYEGFDGGAGSRYQAKREVRSFWYPTWLAQLAALVEGSKLIDAPPRGLTLNDVLPLANDYELLVMFTTAGTFRSDIAVVEAFKAANSKLHIGLVGAHVATLPAQSLEASSALDFVARHEFDYTIQEIAYGKPYAEVDGITWRDAAGKTVHNRDRALIHDMDALPSVAKVYRRDLVIEDYFNGYLHHPYLSFYTGRGCRSKCSFCLWPQTIGGHVSLAILLRRVSRLTLVCCWGSPERRARHRRHVESVREESATSERGWVNEISAGVEWSSRRMPYHGHARAKWHASVPFFKRPRTYTPPAARRRRDEFGSRPPVCHAEDNNYRHEHLPR